MGELLPLKSKRLPSQLGKNVVDIWPDYISENMLIFLYGLQSLVCVLAFNRVVASEP